jgi:hypothetical protein
LDLVGAPAPTALSSQLYGRCGLGEAGRPDVRVVAADRSPARARDPAPDPRAQSCGGRLALIVDPAGGHNVVARTPCIDDVRIRWLDNPTRPPPDECLGAERIRWDLP